MDFKYPAMGPYVGRPNNFRFVWGSSSILFPLKNIGPIPFFFFVFLGESQLILTKIGPETIDF